MNKLSFSGILPKYLWLGRYHSSSTRHDANLITLSHLEQEIGYTFKDISLLGQALTHSSFANDSEKELRSNERLEFLGDAILQKHITTQLYFHFPDYNEGQLTKLRSNLVSTVALADRFDELNLTSYLRIGSNILLASNIKRIMANTFEALIGAIYVDGGDSEVAVFIESRFTNLIKQTPDVNRDFGKFHNPVGYLQEKLKSLPRYDVIKRTGPDHSPCFHVTVSSVEGKVLGSAKGSSIKEANRCAAAEAIIRMKL
jgi:ribonuclease III